jgi:hypothetical protein
MLVDMYSFPAMQREPPQSARPLRSVLWTRAVRGFVIASLLTSAAAGGLWWRGSAHADYVGWSGHGVHFGLLNEDGFTRVEWTSDQAVPAGWRAVSMPPSARLHGWQSSWEGDLAAATRVGGSCGVAWRIWRTGRGAFAHGDRPRRSLYLSHPFLVGAGLAMPLACLARRAVAVTRRHRRDDEEMA